MKMKTKHLKNFQSEDKEKPNFKMNEKKPFNFKTKEKSRVDNRKGSLREFDFASSISNKNIKKNKYYRFLTERLNKNP